MHEDYLLPRLRPAHSTRREFPGPHGCDGFTTKIRLDRFMADLERRVPGARRWIAGFRPFVDARGTWHAGPVLRATRAPLSVRDALLRMEDQRLKMEGQGQ